MKGKIRCIVVDDEEYAADIVKNYIDRTDNIELIARCTNAFEMMETLESEQADLIFLDIQMPQMDGLQAIEFLGESGPFVIFTTAYQEHAVQAFELNVVDYLLKPFSYERFCKAIEKVKLLLPKRTNAKYSKTGLTNEESQQIYKAITDHLQKNKPFLNPRLRLADLAEQIGVNRNHLSQAVNTSAQQTFWNFMNQFRLEEAKSRLQNPKYRHLTIEAIAIDSGFNSVSAFNTIFKKSTGLTPSEFKAAI